MIYYYYEYQGLISVLKEVTINIECKIENYLLLNIYNISKIIKILNISVFRKLKQKKLYSNKVEPLEIEESEEELKEY